MGQQTIECPYCSAVNPAETVTKGSGYKISLKFIDREKTSNSVSVSPNVKCVLCGRKYDFVMVKDILWLSSKFLFGETVLQQLRNILQDSYLSLKNLHQFSTGIAKPNKRNFHLCFKINQIRFYIDCYWQKGYLVGVEAVKV